VLKAAARDARYLVDHGYPKESAIRFVSDHHRLPEEQRFVLTRVVVASDTAKARRDKIQPLKALHGRALFIDGYNVLISVESLLGGNPYISATTDSFAMSRGYSGATDPQT
jgi:hypothetical protein